jgi:ketosteroid isomerase-like protein
MNKTKTILSDFYDAWRDQDVDRMASYLPHDFAHVIHVPSELEPLGGERLGKAASLEPLAQIFAQYDCLSLEASEMMIEGDRAAVEIEMHCRHRETREVVKATKANFWTLESGWPVSLTEYYVVRPFQDLMTTVVGRNALVSNRT